MRCWQQHEPARRRGRLCENVPRPAARAGRHRGRTLRAGRARATARNTRHARDTRPREQAARAARTCAARTRLARSAAPLAIAPRERGPRAGRHGQRRLVPAECGPRAQRRSQMAAAGNLPPGRSHQEGYRRHPGLRHRDPVSDRCQGGREIRRPGQRTQERRRAHHARPGPDRRIPRPSRARRNAGGKYSRRAGCQRRARKPASTSANSPVRNPTRRNSTRSASTRSPAAIRPSGRSRPLKAAWVTCRSAHSRVCISTNVSSSRRPSR